MMSARPPDSRDILRQRFGDKPRMLNKRFIEKFWEEENHMILWQTEEVDSKWWRDIRRQKYV
jgi:hypothetical protein